MSCVSLFRSLINVTVNLTDVYIVVLVYLYLTSYILVECKFWFNLYFGIVFFKV